MPNEIITKIIEQKVDRFKQEFIESREVFYDEKEQKLIHSGEFGSHREKLCKEFFKLFIRQDCSFGNGFVVNSSDKVSKQCDLIIHKPRNSPLLQDSDLKNFYPIESVVAIGEIKSKITKSQLKKALIKLAETKEIRSGSGSDKQTIENRSWKPKQDPLCQIFTFLMCEEISDLGSDFEIKNYMNDVYKNIDNTFRHNVVLSLKDGLFCYKHPENKYIQYPTAGINCHDFSFLKGEQLKEFLHFLYMSTGDINTLNVDIGIYTGIASD
jgi:hypothetical protein